MARTPAGSRKVVLKGTGIRNEDDAGGAITPGHLLDFDGSGDVVVHPIAGANAAPRFAVEQDLLGQDIDNAYASGDNVMHETLHVGQQVNALVADGAAAITKGDFLESAGDGTLRSIVDVAQGSPQPVLVPTRNVVAQALETVDNSAGGAPVRIVAEVV